jgi:hypothetical protein
VDTSVDRVGIPMSDGGAGFSHCPDKVKEAENPVVRVKLESPTHFLVDQRVGWG